MPTAQSFLPLRSVELEVLTSLAGGPQHGYAILQDADRRWGGTGRSGFEIPTLYRALRRMAAAGLIQPAPAQEPDDDPRRQYWETTPLGQAVQEAEFQRLEALLHEGRSRVLDHG